MKNYELLEQSARRAKQVNSFNEYIAGSATKEYEAYCQRAEENAEKAIKRLQDKKAPAESVEKANYYLEKYKEKKLEWMINLYSNRASVPSVMISGAGNFPTARKNKQNAREESLYKNDPDDYFIEKIRALYNGAHVIKSDDKNAVERIQAKIERLKTLPDPFGNKSAEIRRLKERLLALAPDLEEFQEMRENVTVNGAKTYEEILKLWDVGIVKAHEWNDKTSYYFSLPLDFYNGKRHYRELLSFETDEIGQHIKRYSLDEGKEVQEPLTDQLKYRLIIGKISGSGNKKIILQHLKSLEPQEVPEEAQEGPEETDLTINGEQVEVIRNRELMRLQLIFDGKPDADTRNKLKANGFKWAPSQGAWQRLLNDNAEHALKRIIDNEI